MCVRTKLPILRGRWCLCGAGGTAILYGCHGFLPLQIVSSETKRQLAKVSDFAKFLRKRNCLGVKERRRKNEAEWAPRLNKLGMGRTGLAVILEMCLGRFHRVVRCVFVVSAG